MAVTRCWRLPLLLLLLGLLAAVAHFGSQVEAVDRNKFRTCGQTDFCKRLRLGAPGSDNPLLERSSVRPTGAWSWDESSKTLSGQLRSSVRPLQDPLVAKLVVLRGGVVRFMVDEAASLHPRWQVPDVLQPAGLHPFAGEVQAELAEDGGVKLRFQVPSAFGGAATAVDTLVELHSEPFMLTQSLAGEEVLRLNARDLLKLEPFRERNPRPAADADAGRSDPALSKFPFDRPEEWEERVGGHTYSHPRGPSAVSLDVLFGNADRVYGIPEHASSFALKSTTGGQPGAYSEPYRLYNLDVFEYELDVPMALYGSVPFMVGHSAKTGTSSGFLWLNSAETFVDVSPATTEQDGSGSSSGGLHTQWISETGILDAFLLPGPSAYDLWQRYAELTGYQALPPKWSIAHHQCRWNYKSQADSLAVDAGYDEHDIPYDTLWLDIEHTVGKRYWTWDRANFPQPKALQEALANHGRHLVTIVDPHMKRDDSWSVHKDLLAKDLYVKNAKGGVYEGWCWPGSSSYPDFLLPEVRAYWAERFRYENYAESSPTLHIWNDMNEPSVFNGPEVTMQKDVKHLRGTVEHRDVHNLYGFYVHMATHQGMMARDPEPQRPFVLSRAFFAGSQRYGAIWTGDNTADWKHLEASVPMLLSLNIAGIHFSGADVGGFFGNADAELMARWYQVAAFQPFFRNHAHVDTKRREPWVFGDPWTSIMRDAIRQRYRFLPYLYTAFWQSHTQGAPIMRPLWAEFPTEAEVLDEERLFLMGSALLVVPVVEPGKDSVSARLPGTERWVDLRDGRSYVGGDSYGFAAALEEGIPVLQRAGSIVATRERARRSSLIQDRVRDPLSLSVALDSRGQAQGQLYQDDGLSFAYNDGRAQFSARTLRAELQGGVLRLQSVQAVESAADFSAGVLVERIVVQSAPGLAELRECILTVGSVSQPVELQFAQERLTLRKPAMLADADWSIVCQ